MKGVVVVPTYNERENIEELIEKTLSTSPDIDILIVDDNSPDGTGEIAEKIAKENPRVKVLHRPGKMGLGSAYVEGFKWALEKGYDFIMEMDADFSHNPEDIPRFIEKIKEYDLVIGSRYTDGVSVVNWPISRLLLSYFANIYARTVTGVPIMDLTGGFKCFRREVLESINLDTIMSDGYAFQIEMNYRAYKKGFRITEIPIIFIERRAGSSKMSKKIVWEAFWLVWKLRFGRKKF
ncbi:MAG: polyprenol monophosphomannose synthase [Candidatus Hydrothermae bacterium]|nr:polyprenol monophosphomannose synthase [Candidatus Hydrothermae bacterium]